MTKVFRISLQFSDSTKACKGVDLNRNWGYHWGEAGVSHNSCSDIYCGTGPFSELESQNIKNYVEALNPTPVLGHSIHSYSQLWLWPYGYAYNAYPPNKAEIVSNLFSISFKNVR